jgi:hypothetical protein
VNLPPRAPGGRTQGTTRQFQTLCDVTVKRKRTVRVSARVCREMGKDARDISVLDDVPDAFQLEVLHPEVCPHQTATPLANSFIIGTAVINN